jgi:hypothetical protein
MPKKKKRKARNSLGLTDEATYRINEGSSGMALTITSNLTLVDDADDATNWETENLAPGHGIDTAQQVQGNGCYAGLLKTAGIAARIYYNNGSNIDLSDELLRLWVRFTELSKLENADDGGIAVYVEDSSGNWGEWYVGGYLTVINESWQNIIVRTSLPFQNTSTTSPTMTQIHKVGISVRMHTKPARSDNIFVDVIRYGDGITITGTNAITGDGFSEIADEDEDPTNLYGVFYRLGSGIYALTGKLVFGDSSGTGSIDFTDNSSAKIMMLKNNHANTEAPAPSASIMYGTTLDGQIGFEVVGNSTGTTNFQLGTVVGSGDDRRGILGGLLYSVEDGFVFDSETDSADIDSCELYGVTLEGAEVVKLSGTAQEAIGCTFINCKDVQPNTAEFLNNTIISPTPHGLELTGTNDTSYTNFIASGTSDRKADKVVVYRASSSTVNQTLDKTKPFNTPGGGFDAFGVSAVAGTTDYCAFGYRNPFGRIEINVAVLQPRVGGALVWEYYNGSSWTALDIITDDTNTLSSTGANDANWVVPNDWAPAQLLNEPSMFYVRLRITTVMTTPPQIQEGKIKDAIEYHLRPTATTVTADNLSFFGHPSDYPQWHVENDQNATTVDSYPESNQDSSLSLSTTVSRVAQTFVATAGELSNARFYLKKTNSPTGYATAKLYATSGGAPTGDPLAVSESTFDVTRLDTTNYQLVQFEFDCEYTLVASTTYAIALEYTATSTNTVDVGTDNSTPGHSGTGYTYNGSWSSSTHDVCFYVSRDGIVTITALGGNPSTDVSTGSPPGATCINNQVDITVHAIDATSLADVQNARVYIFADTGGDLVAGTAILDPESQLTDVNGEVSDTFIYTSDQPVLGWVRRGTNPTRYKQAPISGTITADGFSWTAALVRDE